MAITNQERIGKALDLLRQALASFVGREMQAAEKAGDSLIEAAGAGALKPWREIVIPHPYLASGCHTQAEFAADLGQVHLGEGSDEYRKPIEFFRHTFLTESLKRLRVGAAEALSYNALVQGGLEVARLAGEVAGRSVAPAQPTLI